MAEEQQNEPTDETAPAVAPGGVPEADEVADDDTIVRGELPGQGAATADEPSVADDVFADSAPDEQDVADSAAFADDRGAAGGAPPLYGIGPFSLREVILAGVWLVAFVVSFFSTSTFGFSSVWTRGIDWILPIGVPTVAVFLVVLRRLSPSGIRRVGSLGIDQFASVAFSVAAVLWLGQIWSQISVTIAGGPWVTSWVIWVEFILMLAGVVLTVFAPVIPGLADDFRERAEIPAHRVARGARPVQERPRTAPVGAGQSTYAAADAFAPADPYAPADSYAPAAYAPAAEAADTSYPPADYAPEPQEQQPAEQQPAGQQAFWALAPEERDVVDENGVPLFRIGPTAWALVIEDRGSSFVIRHEDGRVGFLTDVTGVTRG